MVSHERKKTSEADDIPQKNVRVVDYADDLALLANKPTQAKGHKSLSFWV